MKQTFRTPTWMDYLRLNHRLTSVDKDLDQRLRQSHTGELPPRQNLAIERPTAAPRTARIKAVGQVESVEMW